MAAIRVTQTRTGTVDATGRLEALFDAHHDRLDRLARRMTRDAEEARDLVQEAFLRAARHIRRVPSGSSGEEAWLVRVLVNLCRDAGRRRRVRGRIEPLDAAPPAAGFEEAAVARATVRAALGTLSARRRAAVVLHYLEERPVAECAALLGVARVTVRWHLAAARRALAAFLKRPARAGEVDHDDA